MDAETARARARARTWFARTTDWHVWVHALCAAIVGAVFSVLLRNLGIAAVIAHGVYFLIAAIAGIAAALAFGSLGRVFTRRRAGWWLTATIFIWTPAVVAVSFVVFTNTGSFDQLEPYVPAVGALVAGVTALLAWGGPPRWIAVIVLLATSITVAVTAFA